MITTTQVHSAIAVDSIGKRWIAGERELVHFDSSRRSRAKGASQTEIALPRIVEDDNGAVVAAGEYVLQHVAPEKADHLTYASVRFILFTVSAMPESTSHPQRTTVPTTLKLLE
jgi:hypothetical protein